MVRVDPLFGLRVQALHLGRGQVVHHVEVMCRQVDHDSHVADPGWKRTQPPSLQLIEPSDLIPGDPPLQLAHRRVESLDVSHRQDEPVLFGRRHKLPRLLEVGRDRLLDQDMEAAAQCRQPRLEVKPGGDRDDRGVELLAIQHLLPRCVGGERTLA